VLADSQVVKICKVEKHQSVMSTFLISDVPQNNYQHLSPTFYLKSVYGGKTRFNVVMDKSFIQVEDHFG
jgi:hypothetical protein